MVSKKVIEELDALDKGKDVENAEKEIELMKTSLENLKRNLADVEKKKALHQRMAEIAIENYEVVNPHFKYETIPEYQEAALEHYKLAVDLKMRHEYDPSIHRLQSTIETQEVQIKSQMDKLEELKNE